MNEEDDEFIERMMNIVKDERRRWLQVGYTIATGKLYCSLGDFYSVANELLGRPVYTHEFANPKTWEDLQSALKRYENKNRPG